MGIWDASKVGQRLADQPETGATTPIALGDANEYSLGKDAWLGSQDHSTVLSCRMEERESVCGSPCWGTGLQCLGLAHTLWSTSLCLTAVSKFFSESCIPGANKDRFPNLCSLCTGTGAARCASSPEEPYSGYAGAFK